TLWLASTERALRNRSAHDVGDGSWPCKNSRARRGSIALDRARRGHCPEEPRSRRFHWEQDRDALAVIRTDRWTPGRSERTDCDKRPAPRALHYEPRGPVIRAPVQFQPGSMPAFLIARTASGEVRNVWRICH